MGKMHKGHYGEYTGNAKWSRDHAHTRVTSENYDDAVKDDAAHIDYLKRDIIYDDHHGHSDEKMTADEKHISKLAGDMKYDKEHHGSPARELSNKDKRKLKRQARRTARQTEGDRDEIYYNLYSDKIEEMKRNAAPQSHCMGDK